MFSRSKDRSSEERLSSNSQYLGRIFPFSLLREAETQTPVSILMSVKVLYQGGPQLVLEGPRSSWDLCPTGTLVLEKAFSVAQKTRLE